MPRYTKFLPYFFTISTKKNTLPMGNQESYKRFGVGCTKRKSFRKIVGIFAHRRRKRNRILTRGHPNENCTNTPEPINFQLRKA